MASASDNTENLKQFKAVTGASEEQAKFFLDSANGNIDIAITSFYENGSGGNVVDSEEIAKIYDSDRQASGTGTGSAANQSDVKKTSSGSKIETESISSEDEDSDSGQVFFAGGSTTSGQQILGPPKKDKKGDKFVNEFFRRARESGGIEVNPNEPSTSSGQRRAFTGQAFRLGSDTVASQKLDSEQSGQGGYGSPPRTFKLKMWNNGFSVDDGELRDFNDPGNRAFLNDVMRGNIPTELLKEARGGEVHLDLEDHKHEEYTRPKATSKPFQGVGHTLGGIVPSVQSNKTDNSSESDKESNEKKAKSKFPVNEKEPVTTLQVRMADGSRLILKMNHSHTIGNLRQYISLARPNLSTFSLRTSFPNKELDKDSQTLKEAGVLNAAILLRKN